MCFNAESSIGSWTVAMALSVVILCAGGATAEWIAMFIITFTLIQLLEGVIWLDGGKGSSSTLAVKMILVALWLQPLVQVAGAVSVGAIPVYIWPVIVIPLLLILLYYTHSAATDTSFSATQGPNGHLVWHRGNLSGSKFLTSSTPLALLYLSGLLLPLLFIQPRALGVTLAAFGLVSFFTARSLYPTEEFSSMWCFIAVLYAVIAFTLVLSLNTGNLAA